MQFNSELVSHTWAYMAIAVSGSSMSDYDSLGYTPARSDDVETVCWSFLWNFWKIQLEDLVISFFFYKIRDLSIRNHIS